MSQGMQATSRGWKRRECEFSRKKRSPADTLIFAHLDPFWTFHLQNCKRINLYCSKATKFMVICYGIHRKTINHLTPMSMVFVTHSGPR